MRKRFIKWLIKLRKDGVRKTFLRWAILIILPHHHLQKDSPGRRRKVEAVNMEEVQQIIEGMGKEEGAE